jgi:hypothetical protein
MNRKQFLDPYNGFKSDAERRKALGTYVRWRALSVTASSIVLSLAYSHADLLRLLRLLSDLHHLGQ